MEECDKDASGSAAAGVPEEVKAAEEDLAALQAEVENQIIRDLNEKYLRLYAEFDNYRKRVNREKEDLLKYGNESLLYELLPAIDNLELALKHASEDTDRGLMQGVQMTLKELHRILEKFGLKKIEASGKCFDPAVHHAMSQVEREDIDEKMVAEEFRTGYFYGDKVLRPSLVAVSVRPKKTKCSTQTAEDGSEEVENMTKTDIEEEE